MATKTELLKSILTASGVDPDALPDNLESTLLKAIAENCGAYDWNASEGEPGYIANRTHWAEICVETILEETTLVAVAEGIFSTAEGKAFENAVYDVNYNGVKYECTAFNFGALISMGQSLWAIGNPRVGSSDLEDTGEPFFIAFMDGTIIMTNDGLDEITVSVTKTGEIVHKLPEKYLPETAPFYFEIVCNTSGGISYTASVLVAKLEEELASGRMIIAKFSIYGIPQTNLLHLVSYYADESNPYGKLLLFSGNAYKVTLTPQEDGMYVVENVS